MTSAVTDPSIPELWFAGSAADEVPESDDGLVVSYTEYTFDRYRDLPGIAFAAMRLRRSLRELPGAEGVLLHARPISRRMGSLTAWRDEESLRAFVRLPYHLEIMRKYRERGSLRSATFRQADFTPQSGMAEARSRVPLSSSIGDHARRFLAINRLIIGTLSWAVPGFSARRALGLEVERQTSYWARVFGVRDIALGHGLLVRPGAQQEGWLTAGMVCDVADFAAAVVSWRKGEIPGKSAAMLMLLPMGALALARVAASSPSAIPAETTE